MINSPQQTPNPNVRHAHSVDWQERRNPTLLVVEDHDDTREMLKILLSMHGCRVFEASDGVQAICITERIHPDLILLDMKIPLLDGLSVARAIRLNPDLKNVRIVAVTGNAAPQFLREALDAGCDCCLVKPIDFGRLEELVRSVRSAPAPLWQPRYSLAVRSRGALCSVRN